MALGSLPVLPLSAAEQALVQNINQTWTQAQAMNELKTSLQTVVEVELATLPIYLFTYYSINRTPAGSSTDPTPLDFPTTDVSRFADQAGGIIMSVAVEEMLHMSLASNILYALGQMPVLYMKSPEPYPTDLPGHAELGPDKKSLAIPLSKFSLDQLWEFLEIEYPPAIDAPPEGTNWQTIGQIYSYIRCIISSNWITDADFQVGAVLTQIQPTNFSPNNIDTVYPTASFNATCPVPASASGSAASVAAFSSREDAYAGPSELMTINSRQAALQAIQTISAQGEGYGPTQYDDLSLQEYSHYFKFLKLQSQLEGYPDSEPLPALPVPPPPAQRQFTPAELATFVFNFPDNPTAAAYPDGLSDVANLVSALYQYMLIMTETIFLQQPAQQKIYFNQALHRSMIWILDKIIQAMRVVPLNGSEPLGPCLAPTFENYSLGPRDGAFANLVAMSKALDQNYGSEKWYKADIKYYVDLIPTLPDVSSLWTTGAPKTSGAAVTAVSSVATPAAAGSNYVAKKPKPAAESPGCDASIYDGLQQFPPNPPATIPDGGVRHACMGLNSCENQGRTGNNACAGQGYCSTALAYNFADPAQPVIQDHTCHVLNACKGQGGCGLYGTADEQSIPGANGCATLGSCATPINAERFSTDGPNRGLSVWALARKVFTENSWPTLVANNPKLPPAPPALPTVFQNGPTIEWIQDYSDHGMTACGSSGMSGAGSCS